MVLGIAGYKQSDRINWIRGLFWKRREGKYRKRRQVGQITITIMTSIEF